jgi:hypothetical protein
MTYVEILVAIETVSQNVAYRMIDEAFEAGTISQLEARKLEAAAG